MPAQQRIFIKGLEDFRRDLKVAGDGLDKRLQRTLKEAVAPIARDAQQRYDRLHPTALRRRTPGRRPGRGRRSIRALATQRRAQVAMGGKKAPYVLGQEFGSLQGPRKRQFPVARRVTWGTPRWRGGGGQHTASEGNFFTPAVQVGVQALGPKIERMLDGLFREAYPKGGVSRGR
jgi:hypothetical protein